MRLAGPLQSWGDSSRFTRRETRQQPTKSGVLGLLAAADGRRRTDEIEDLARLRFGVRVDQPGRLIRDYQTARPLGAEHSGLSQRYYLADAVFVAAVEGDRELLLGLDEKLHAPTFPLYLGRRSCPPSQCISLGVTDADLEASLQSRGWEASPWFRKTAGTEVRLEIFVDANPGDDAAETVRDVPRSFDSTRREYAWRDVARRDLTLQNPDGSAVDYFAAVVGG